MRILTGQTIYVDGGAPSDCTAHPVVVTPPATRSPSPHRSIRRCKTASLFAPVPEPHPGGVRCRPMLRRSKLPIVPPGVSTSRHRSRPAQTRAATVLDVIRPSFATPAVRAGGRFVGVIAAIASKYRFQVIPWATRSGVCHNRVSVESRRFKHLVAQLARHSRCSGPQQHGPTAW